MSIHSYSRCWLHLVWGTKGRQHFLAAEESRKRLHGFLIDCAGAKGFPLQTHFVNPDHVHALIDLPATVSIEDVVKSLKGVSSHWINQTMLTPMRFSWGRGYGAFSVSQSVLEKVTEYIKNQEEHHRQRTFEEELKLFITNYGLKLQGGDMLGEEEEVYEVDYSDQCAEVIAWAVQRSANR